MNQSKRKRRLEKIISSISIDLNIPPNLFYKKGKYRSLLFTALYHNSDTDLPSLKIKFTTGYKTCYYIIKSCSFLIKKDIEYYDLYNLMITSLIKNNFFFDKSSLFSSSCDASTIKLNTTEPIIITTNNFSYLINSDGSIEFLKKDFKSVPKYTWDLNRK